MNTYFNNTTNYNKRFISSLALES